MRAFLDHHPRSGHLTRKLPLLGALVLLAATFVGIPATQARGDGPRSLPAESHSTRSTVPMVVDCERSSAGGLAVARAHGLCGGTPGRSIEPSNVVSGNCGSSTLWMYDNGGGYAEWFQSLSSNWGPIIAVSWHITWSNLSCGVSDTFGGVAAPFFTYWTNETAPVATLPGFVTSVMSGSVLLASGIVCNIMYPGDQVTVTG